MKIIKIADFPRKKLYEQYIDAIQPICYATVNVDISQIVKYDKINPVMMYCIQNAAQKEKHFHYDFYNENELVYYDNVCTNLVVVGNDGELHYASIPYNERYDDFENDYIKITKYCRENNADYTLDNCAKIETSTTTSVVFESVQSGYGSKLLRPFLAWGKYEKKLFKSCVKITIRFHHALLDGGIISRFFVYLQEELKKFKINS